jgi:hypothetical protein
VPGHCIGVVRLVINSEFSNDKTLTVYLVPDPAHSHRYIRGTASCTRFRKHIAAVCAHLVPDRIPNVIDSLYAHDILQASRERSV